MILSQALFLPTKLSASESDWRTRQIADVDMVLVTAMAATMNANYSGGQERFALVAETQQALKEGFGVNDTNIVHQYIAIPALTFWMPVTTFRNLPMDRYGNRRSPDLRLTGVIVSAEIGGAGAQDESDQSGSGGLSDSRSIVGAQALHTLGFTGAGQRIAVIDSGIDSDHPDFAGRIIAEACFCYNPEQGDCCPNGEATQSGVGSAEDDHGHGTHVAGICAADGNNIGVAPEAEIVVVKTIDRFNSFWSFSDQTAALDWLYSQNLKLTSVNMSLGTFSSFVGDCDESASWMLAAFQAVENLKSQGTEVVVAAMNDAKVDELPVPACLSNTITIGATDDLDVAASFSNSSPNVDFFAPGVGIVSSSLDGGSVALSGTSMATPHMAGGIALVRQALSDEATAQEIAETIATTSPIVADSHGNSAPRMDLYLTYEDMSAYGPPSAPTIVRVDHGDGEIYLTFQVDDDGGAPVTLVTAICTDGTNQFVATNSSSPITVGGLSNGTSYTCSITATNSVGTSPASAATSPITPEETASGLPIWLLHRASQ
jgi:subtilisin family serine protease